MRLVRALLSSGTGAFRACRCSGSIIDAFVIVGVSATSQFGVQLLSVAITIGWTVLASYVILRVMSLVIGLRIDQQNEIERPYLSQHAERGYHSN